MKLINADKLEGIFKEACKTAYFRHNPQVKDGAELIMEFIRELDTIDPKSLREHGKWIWKNGEPDNFYCICSNCNAEDEHLYPFCPNCGAKMDLEVR